MSEYGDNGAQNLIPAGTYRAKGLEAKLATTRKGTEQAVVLFTIIDGEHAGRTVTWFGHFTPKAQDRTIESLIYCGWDGADLDHIEGIDRNKVSITVEHNEWEGKVSARVAWVNKPADLGFVTELEPVQARSFAARMKGKVLAVRQKMEQGARAAPKPKPQPASTFDESEIPF